MGEGLKRAFKAAKDTRTKANPMPSNPVSAEMVADIVLRAAGSGFKYYMPSSKARIIENTQKALDKLSSEHESNMAEYERIIGHKSYPEVAGELAALQSQVLALREALDFYADVSKYPAPYTGGFGDLWKDCGETAKKALAATDNGGRV